MPVSVSSASKARHQPAPLGDHLVQLCVVARALERCTREVRNGRAGWLAVTIAAPRIAVAGSAAHAPQRRPPRARWDRPPRRQRLAPRAPRRAAAGGPRGATRAARLALCPQAANASRAPTEERVTSGFASSSTHVGSRFYAFLAARRACVKARGVQKRRAGARTRAPQPPIRLMPTWVCSSLALVGEEVTRQLAAKRLVDGPGQRRGRSPPARIKSRSETGAARGEAGAQIAACGDAHPVAAAAKLVGDGRDEADLAARAVGAPAR